MGPTAPPRGRWTTTTTTCCLLVVVATPATALRLVAPLGRAGARMHAGDHRGRPLRAHDLSMSVAFPLPEETAKKIVKEEEENPGGLARDALKVAVAGGGVGGLSTALALLKLGFDVTVYERTSAFARFGGPIQLASNALSTLKAIDEELFRRVMAKFTFTGTRRCGIKDGVRSDGSFRVTPVFSNLFHAAFDPKTPQDWFVTFPLKQCADAFKLPYTGVIDRPDLQEILLDECRTLKADCVQNGVGVVGYEEFDDKVVVKLADGTTADADVLVGADGIWSAVRATMYDEGPVKQVSENGQRRQGCRYSGYTVFAGEAILPLQDYYDVGYNVYVGPKRYFVKSDVGDGRVQWYAFCALPPGTKRAEDQWESGDASSQEQGKDVIDYISDLHAGWSPEIENVLRSTPPENVEQRDLYDRPLDDLLTKPWASDRVVLIGDAVHSMMPNLGQGGCQAIEDAYELAKSLAACTVVVPSSDGAGQTSTTRSASPSQENAQEKAKAEDVKLALESFYKRRLPRVATVVFLSRLASDLIINAFDTPWSVHDNLGTSWKSYLTFFWKPVLQFLIFPAQFLFLYSYHPTGPMAKLPQRLEAEWRDRHKRDAEAAFARAKDGIVQESSKGSFLNAGDDADNSPPASVPALPLTPAPASR